MSQNDHVNLAAQVSERRRKPIVDLQPFTLPSTFWPAEYLDDAGSAQHVPALFWLAEAARPRVAVTAGGPATLHFALCQAVQRLALSTSCYYCADEPDGSAASLHSGAGYLSYGQRRYPTFSQVMTGDPISVSDRFEDASVDILCIGERLEPEEFKRCVETWRPKLSRRGVLVACNIGPGEERDTDVGNASLFGGTARFEFHHGSGLGIYAIGSELPPLVELLFEARKDATLRVALRSLFWRLGQGSSDAFNLGRAESKLKALRKKHTAMEQHVEQARESLKQRQDELEEQSGQFDDLKYEYGRFRKASHEELTRLRTRSATLERVQTELKSQASRLQSELAETAAARREETSRLKDALERIHAESDRLRVELESTVAQSQAQAETLRLLTSSWSWRLTRPLRTTSSALRRLLGRQG